MRVKAEQYISWRDGIFEFENMRLERIALHLTRWYDINFEFARENTKDRRFTGVLKKRHAHRHSFAYYRQNDGCTFSKKIKNRIYNKLNKNQKQFVNEKHLSKEFELFLSKFQAEI